MYPIVQSGVQLMGTKQSLYPIMHCTDSNPREFCLYVTPWRRPPATVMWLMPLVTSQPFPFQYIVVCKDVNDDFLLLCFQLLLLRFFNSKLTFPYSHLWCNFLLCACLCVGETVSLVDVDISQRGANCLHPPTPPPPPRRSLSLLGTSSSGSSSLPADSSLLWHIDVLPCVADDFGGPPQQQGPFAEHSVGASMQSLPPRPLALPPSLSTIQHSLSLNGDIMFLRRRHVFFFFFLVMSSYHFHVVNLWDTIAQFFLKF